MKLKTFLFSLILILSVSRLTFANTRTNEKISIPNYDLFSNCSMQATADVTINYQTDHNKGFNIYNLNSDRYSSSVASGRLSEDIQFNITTNNYTNQSKEQLRNGELAENWRHHTSQLLLRRAGACSKSIQGNNYNAKRNYNRFKANQCSASKSNEFLSESILLYRYSGRYFNNSENSNTSL